MKTLFVAMTLLFSTLAFAGKMKDLQLQHMEAVSQHLWGEPDSELAQTRNTRFVKALPGYFLAIATEVYIFSPKVDDYRWITCTTQFNKVSADDYKVTLVTCD